MILRLLQFCHQAGLRRRPKWRKRLKLEFPRSSSKIFCEFFWKKKKLKMKQIRRKERYRILLTRGQTYNGFTALRTNWKKQGYIYWFNDYIWGPIILQTIFVFDMFNCKEMTKDRIQRQQNRWCLLLIFATTLMRGRGILAKPTHFWYRNFKLVKMWLDHSTLR